MHHDIVIVPFLSWYHEEHTPFSSSWYHCPWWYCNRSFYDTMSWVITVFLIVKISFPFIAILWWVIFVTISRRMCLLFVIMTSFLYMILWDDHFCYGTKKNTYLSPCHDIIAVHHDTVRFSFLSWYHEVYFSWLSSQCLHRPSRYCDKLICVTISWSIFLLLLVTISSPPNSCEYRG